MLVGTVGRPCVLHPDFNRSIFYGPTVKVIAGFIMSVYCPTESNPFRDFWKGEVFWLQMHDLTGSLAAQLASYQPFFNEGTFQRSNFLFLPLHQNKRNLRIRGVSAERILSFTSSEKCRNLEASPEDADSWSFQWGQHASLAPHLFLKPDTSAAAHSWQKSRINFDSLSDLRLSF